MRKRFAIKRAATWAKIQGRKAACLDTSIWVHLHHENSPAAKRVRELLYEEVKAGRLFCPLSAPVLWELYKQNRTSRLERAAIMEDLSLNVCLANSNEVFRSEVIWYVGKSLGGHLPADWRQELFVPLVGYISSGYALEGFPEDAPHELIDKFERLLSDELEALTLTRLLNMRDEKIAAYLKAYPVPPYAANAKKLRESTKGDKKKAFDVEARVVAESYILPVFDQLPVSVKLRFTPHLEALPKDKDGSCLATLLEHLPAIRNYVEIMAIASQDTSRVDRINDFFDLELMSVPLAYCDALVADDKRIKDIIRNRSSLLSHNNCNFVGNMNAFETWLLGASSE